MGHPVVAALLGLGAIGLAGMVVAMAWNVHVRQFRLAEMMASGTPPFPRAWPCPWADPGPWAGPGLRVRPIRW